jgi:hypothetical protein
MLDETEVETIPEARTAPIVAPQPVTPIEVPAPPPALTTGVAFMVPGKTEAYAYYPNDDEFVNGYLDMVNNIMASGKLNAAEKLAKITALEGANDFVLGMIETDKPVLFEAWTKDVKRAKEACDQQIKKG